MKTGGFFKSNWKYILWCVLYVTIVTLLLGATIESFIVTTVLYAVSIFIALSPLGELILRYIQGARKIVTREELEYLYPIWEEIKNESGYLNSNISYVELMIIDAMYINAYAMGNCTVAVTKGMIKAMTPEQLKGILGHELGHIVNGDTKALLISVVGNGIFNLGILFFSQPNKKPMDKLRLESGFCPYFFLA